VPWQQERQGEMRIWGLQKQAAVVGVLKIAATLTCRNQSFLLHNDVC